MSAASSGLVAGLAFALVAAVALLAGRAIDRAAGGAAAGGGDAEGGGPWGWAASLVGGLAAIHLLLLALDLLAVPWSRLTLGTVAVAVAVPGLLAVRGATHRLAIRRLAARISTWDVTAAAVAVAVYAGFAWSLRSTTPDFVYHWGVKGHRYFLARGIDWSFLSDPLRLTDHPDYPNLLPDLYAAAAVVAGNFHPRSAMLWSVLLLALLPLAARATWRRLAVSPRGIALGTVAVTAAAAMFAVGYRLAGGGELALALALLAAAPSLVAPRPSARDDLRLGFAAALAAGSKIEGVPLAAFLVAVHLGRRLVARRRSAERDPRSSALLPAVLRAALPPVLVVVPWAAQCLRWDLFRASNPAILDLSRLGEVLPALIEALGTREWHGLAWLVPLALPLTLAAPRTRPLALVCALQLAFYGWVYLSSPLDPTYYVLSSFPRLLFHLLPITLTALIALLAPNYSGRPSVSARPQNSPGGFT